VFEKLKKEKKFHDWTWADLVLPPMGVEFLDSWTDYSSL